MNGHLTIRRWLAGLAVGAILALMITPMTSWLIRSQFGLQLGGSVPELTSSVPMPGREYTDPPPIPTPNADDDLPLQLASALKSANYHPDNKITAVDRLRSLKSRFPDSPSLYAAILRFATQSEIGIKREEEYLFGSSGKPGEFKERVINTELLSKFDSEAADGERLDPDNAYFPFMRTIGLYAAHRDREALEALSRAATKPRWEEYVLDEVHGQVRLREHVYGRRPALAKTALYAAVLFPHYAALRGSARVTTAKAVAFELAGDSERGYRVRRDLIVVGELMRAQGRSLITNLVGKAISAIALARPGGAPVVESKRGTNSAEATAMRVRRNHERFFAYMTRIGHGEDVAWLNTLLQTGDQAREGLQEALAESGFGGRPMWQLISWWAANLILLTNALWLLLIGGAALILCRTQGIRYGRELPKPVRWGVAAAWFGSSFGIMLESMTSGNLQVLSYALLIAIFVVAQRSWGMKRSLPLVGSLSIVTLAGWLPIPAMVNILAGTLAGVLCYSPDRPSSGPRAAVFSFAATAVIGAAFFGAAWWLSRGVRSLTYAATAIIGQGADGEVVGYAPDVNFVFALSLFAIPVALAVLLVAVSLFNRVPISVGLCRGFRGIALPAACLLLVAYCGTLVSTARQEEFVSKGLAKSLDHEGRYLSELAGKQWPAEVKREAVAPSGTLRK